MAAFARTCYKGTKAGMKKGGILGEIIRKKCARGQYHTRLVSNAGENFRAQDCEGLASSALAMALFRQ